MFAEKRVFSTRIHETFPMVRIVVIYVKFSIQYCLNYLSSLHSLSASAKGSWLFLNRSPCSTRIFSKLDANSGFWQIPLSKQSKLLTTFITPYGQYCFNKMPFGISSAPEHALSKTHEPHPGGP